MYTAKSIGPYFFLRLIKSVWFMVLLSSVYSALVVYFHAVDHIEWLIIPMAIPSIVGTGISLLLGFRANSAYDRWWEARKAWGAIVNDSRTFARQCITFIHSSDEATQQQVQQLVQLQIAWVWALNKGLRKQDVRTHIQRFLSASDLEYVSAQDNIHNAILHVMSKRLKHLHQAQKMDVFEYMNLDNTLTNHSNSMGICERINNTVFPVHYSFILHLSLFIFTILLPMGVAHQLGWATVPITFIVATIFNLIETIALGIQNPFRNRASDTPMDAICRTIEINLLQQWDVNAPLPPKVEPDKNGILM